MKKGEINIETGKLKNVNTIISKISEIIINIIKTANIVEASVKIDPLNKNSWNTDKYFSGTLLSRNIVKSLIILNFMNIT